MEHAQWAQGAPHLHNGRAAHRDEFYDEESCCGTEQIIFEEGEQPEHVGERSHAEKHKNRRANAFPPVTSRRALAELRAAKGGQGIERVRALAHSERTDGGARAWQPAKRNHDWPSTMLRRAAAPVRPTMGM